MLLISEFDCRIDLNLILNVEAFDIVNVQSVDGKIGDKTAPTLPCEDPHCSHAHHSHNHLSKDEEKRSAFVKKHDNQIHTVSVQIEGHCDLDLLKQWFASLLWDQVSK